MIVIIMLRTKKEDGDMQSRIIVNRFMFCLYKFIFVFIFIFILCLYIYIYIPGNLPCHNPQDDCCTHHRAFNNDDFYDDGIDHDGL